MSTPTFASDLAVGLLGAALGWGIAYLVFGHGRGDTPSLKPARTGAARVLFADKSPFAGAEIKGGDSTMSFDIRDDGVSVKGRMDGVDVDVNADRDYDGVGRVDEIRRRVQRAVQRDRDHLGEIVYNNVPFGGARFLGSADVTYKTTYPDGSMKITTTTPEGVVTTTTVGADGHVKHMHTHVRRSDRGTVL